MKEEFKTVAEFNNVIQAQIVAGMLNENGIPAQVFGDSSAYPSVPYVLPVQVKVNVSDYEAAVKLIENPPQVEE